MLNKKLFILPILVFFVVAGIAAAHGPEEVPEPDVLPGNPLYFLKNWSEQLEVFFAFSNTAKAAEHIELAAERLAEAKALADRERPELAVDTVARYEDHLEKALERIEAAKEAGVSTDEISERVAEATVRHQETLALVYEKVPVEAQEAIETAMYKSAMGHDRALEAITAERQQEARQHIDQEVEDEEDRLWELRGRGIPVTIPRR